MIWPRSPSRALPIDDPAWRRLEAESPWLHRLDVVHVDHLKRLVAQFLTEKAISGAHGLRPDDAMCVTIAAQACIPVLNLGLGVYRDFVEIVVYPCAFAVHRRIVDADGLVHEFDDVLAGEAMEGGPVVLSWDDVSGPDRDLDSNIVIHEFVHKLDMADGEADGCPPMPAARRAAWRFILGKAYDDFARTVDDLETSIPENIDPEGPEAAPWYGSLPIDPYAATDLAEFFAVTAEVFYIDPERLANAFPDLFEQYVAYFGVDLRARGDLEPPIHTDRVR